jgi:hypothetical protein
MFGRIETLAPDQTSLLARLTYEGITVRKRAATAPIMRRSRRGSRAVRVRFSSCLSLLLSWLAYVRGSHPLFRTSSLREQVKPAQIARNQGRFLLSAPPFELTLAHARVAE